MSRMNGQESTLRCAFHERIAAASRCANCGEGVCFDCFSIVGDLDICRACADARRVSLASKSRRFVARALDQLLLAAAFVLPVLLIPRELPESARLAGVGLALVGLLSRQGALLHRQGQTIGKLLFDVAIVDLDGRPVQRTRVLFGREIIVLLSLHLPLLLVALLVVARVEASEVFATLGHSLPRVIHLFSTIPGTVVLISFFRREGRAIHEILTGTAVIEVD